ncbi:MAG: hypothetical protein GF417_10140 [Candidatus Latescibacteria bacterium]|nr:hypothetical protein [bacterium]MBD3424786.1 hypothetical protein [Candidatus Latescibacterota bacterium]
MIIVLLGMHKSGTTLLSRMLHESGINMCEDPTRISSYDAGNKYERLEFLIYNTAMLDIRISTFSSDIVETANDLSISRHPRTLAGLLETRIEELSSEHPAWGFKDPRTCMTYRAWREHLPPHRVLVSFRNPYEVAAHLTRSVRNIRMLKRIGRTAGGLNSWYLHNRNILEYYRENGSDFFFIDYNRFMSEEGDGYIDRISEFCQIEISDLRDRDLYRNRMETLTLAQKIDRGVGSVFIRGKVERVYRQLREIERAQF